MPESKSGQSNGHLALIGFGEAGQAFATGLRQSRPGLVIRAYDIKTDSEDAAVCEGKWSDFQRVGVAGCVTLAEALAGASAVFSLVTADQAHVAARRAAQSGVSGALYFDSNSCAPATKRKSADLIDQAGGRYVDCAVMSPVHPRLHKTPLLFAGAHAAAALDYATAMDMRAECVEGDVGAASSIKMVRSIMMKGLEALVLECVLAGRAAGIEDRVLASLEATYPGFNWTERAAYMMERAMTHGVRRAAEMREVAVTIRDLGLDADMAEGTIAWQQRVGELAIKDVEAPGYAGRADAILSALTRQEGSRNG